MFVPRGSLKYASILAIGSVGCSPSRSGSPQRPRRYHHLPHAHAISQRRSKSSEQFVSRSVRGQFVNRVAGRIIPVGRSVDVRPISINTGSNRKEPNRTRLCAAAGDRRCVGPRRHRAVNGVRAFDIQFPATDARVARDGALSLSLSTSASRRHVRLGMVLSLRNVLARFRAR